MPSATYSVTREQLVRLGTLTHRAEAIATEANFVNESLARLIEEIVGKFDSDEAQDAFWDQYSNDVSQVDEVLNA